MGGDRHTGGTFAVRRGPRGVGGRRRAFGTGNLVGGTRTKVGRAPPGGCRGGVYPVRLGGTVLLRLLPLFTGIGARGRALACACRVCRSAGLRGRRTRRPVRPARMVREGREGVRRRWCPVPSPGRLRPLGGIRSVRRGRGGERHGAGSVRPPRRIRGRARRGADGPALPAAGRVRLGDLPGVPRGGRRRRPRPRDRLALRRRLEDEGGASETGRAGRRAAPRGGTVRGDPLGSRRRPGTDRRAAGRGVGVRGDVADPPGVDGPAPERHLAPCAPAGREEGGYRGAFPVGQRDLPRPHAGRPVPVRGVRGADHPAGGQYRAVQDPRGVRSAPPAPASPPARAVR